VNKNSGPIFLVQSNYSTIIWFLF